MNCPKCNQNIDENALFCPTCKKVLKLECPKCGTLNSRNTCRKCGFVIVTKCHKCGKVNQTINGACSKCGFSTYTSASITSSNIDEFACMTIEFPNISDIKTELGSTKLYEKFKANLDSLILNYTTSIDLTREIIDNIYVIRFNKNYTFTESATNAVKSAIEIQNLVTGLNFKLGKMDKTTLSCNIAVLKRSIYSKPSEYKSGFDIRLLNLNPKTDKLLSKLQVITDSSIYEAVCDIYSLSSISAVQIKNEFVMFFELKLAKYIKLPKDEEEKEGKNKVQMLSDLAGDEFEDDIDEGKNVQESGNLVFEKLRCHFSKSKSINLIPDIVKVINQNKKCIISVKGDKRFSPKTGELLSEIQKTNKYSRIHRVTCTDEMKYKPYGFFHELISGINDYSPCPVNFHKHDFSVFKQIDESNFIRDLINYNKREFPHPDDVRYSLFDIFLDIFYTLSNSLIYIENMEKIDDTSMEVLQIIIDKFKDLNVGYLMVSGPEFSLHKNIHSLLFEDYYTEISSKPTPFAEILDSNLKLYTPLLDLYCFQKIARNTKGSFLYFNHAIELLKEKDIILYEKNAFHIKSTENVMIPIKIEEVITKRLIELSKDAGAYKLLGMLLQIGPRIDSLTIDLLEIPNVKHELIKLMEKGYAYTCNNSVYIENYNLYNDIFTENLPQNLSVECSTELLERLFNTELVTPTTAVLYKTIKKEKSEFLTWEKLSHLNTSMGDFSAYLNCSIKFLKLLDNHIDESSQKTIEEYKLDVYENLAGLLYKYTPEKIQNIALIILENLEKTTDDKKVINLCNKMLQGCLISGDYSHALKLIHKILSKFPFASLNPNDENFNITYFLISLVKIEIMFSIGNLNDCIEAGDQILGAITSSNIEKLKPANLTIQQFKETIFESAGFVAISRIILLRDDLGAFLEHLKTNIGDEPKTFELFMLLQKRLQGPVELPECLELPDDKFSKIFYSLLKAFNNFDDYKKFAGDIYQAKINAKLQSLKQIELICDLLIAYSYFKLEEYEKASSVYYNVIENSNENGLRLVWYFAWYLTCELKLKIEETEVAHGIANNIIIQLEKDENSSELLLMLFKVCMYKILLAKNEKDSAKLCINHAMFIKEKYKLCFNIHEERRQSERVSQERRQQ